MNKVTSHFAQTNNDSAVVEGSVKTSGPKNFAVKLLTASGGSQIEACSKLGKVPTAFVSVAIRRRSLSLNDGPPLPHS